MKKRKTIIITMGIIFLLILSIGIINSFQINKKELTPNKDIKMENKTTIKTSNSKDNSTKKKRITSTIAKEKTSSKTTTTTISAHTTKSNNDNKKDSDDSKKTANNSSKNPEKSPNKSTKKSTTTKNIVTTTKKTTTKKPPTTTKKTTKKTTTKKATTTSKIVDEVDSLRNKLESTYHIKIKYGNELENYRPKGLTPTKMTDKDKIKKYLKLIDNELKKYPVGFFKEFNGMPLTIYLVSSVPGNVFAGFTDKEFMNDIKITLRENEFFEYTFNHEIMHYIDAYLEIIMYPNNPYDEYMKLNPVGYQYGRINQEYNYGYNQQLRGAYFLNDYSQSSVREDRAEIFKQMITRLYKPVGMFDNEETIQKKALVIDKQIRDNFKSARGTLYWDKIVR